jgi:hypothetical protein
MSVLHETLPVPELCWRNVVLYMFSSVSEEPVTCTFTACIKDGGSIFVRIILSYVSEQTTSHPSNLHRHRRDNLESHFMQFHVRATHVILKYNSLGFNGCGFKCYATLHYVR